MTATRGISKSPTRITQPSMVARLMRTVIRVFADDRIEDHLIADQALLDDSRRQRCGHYAAFFAGLAGTLFAPGHQHEILHRLNIQLLALFVADHRGRSPAATAHALLTGAPTTAPLPFNTAGTFQITAVYSC